MSIFFAALFLATGVHVPYLPVWLEWHGFSPNEIAVILASPMFLRVFTTPIITTLADKARDRANVLTLLVAASALASLGYFLPPAYAVVLAVSLVLAIVWTPHPPLGDSVALSGVRRWGFSYTSMRIWGSMSYLVGNLAGGFILSHAGVNAVPVLITGGLVALFIACFAVPRVGPPRKPRAASLDGLLAPERFSRRFIYAVVGAGLIVGSHAFINSFMSIHWKAIGYGDTLIGLLWSFSVAAEVMLFWLFPRLFRRQSSIDLLTISASAAVLRWVLYSLIGPLALGLGGYFVAQGMHALSTGLMLIAVQKLISEEISEERTGAAQGIAYFSNGMALASLTLLSGPLFGAIGEFGTVPMIGVALSALVVLRLAAAQPATPAVRPDPALTPERG